MDLAGLETFAIYAAIGTLAVLGALVMWSLPWHPTRLWPLLNRLKELPAIISFGLVLVLILIGLVIDNTADSIDDDLKCLEGIILPSDSALRAEVLFKQQGQSCTPRGLARELAACNAFQRFGGTKGASIEQQIRAGLAPSAAEASEAADALYYIAKSRVYREGTYTEDMQRIHRNISAMRSLAILSLALLLPLAAAAIRELWVKPRRQRKFAIHAAIAVAVLLAAYGLSRWNLGLEEKDFDGRAYGYFSSILMHE